MSCRLEPLGCGHEDCPVHHRCDSRRRAGCALDEECPMCGSSLELREETPAEVEANYLRRRGTAVVIVEPNLAPVVRAIRWGILAFALVFSLVLLAGCGGMPDPWDWREETFTRCVFEVRHGELRSRCEFVRCDVRGPWLPVGVVVVDDPREFRNCEVLGPA